MGAITCPAPLFPSGGLNRAADRLPGGLPTMMHLAWLSIDDRARAVAALWNSLSAEDRRYADIEALCNAAGIRISELVRAVTGTACELAIDFSALLAPLELPRWSLTFALARVLRTNDRACPITDRGVRRRDARMVSQWRLRACDETAGLRKKLRLSQTQCACLFMTDTRTVRRWEAHEVKPTMRRQWFLALFLSYVGANGARAFLQRFVRQEPRYRKPGRPTDRAELHGGGCA